MEVDRHETLKLRHVSSCEMLHFVTSSVYPNRKRKQTPESAQYELEITFKLIETLLKHILFKYILYSVCILFTYCLQINNNNVIR